MRFRVFNILLFFVILVCLISCKQEPEQYDLNLKAAVVYQIGGVQPVARTTFYLLNKDIAEIANEAQFFGKWSGTNEFQIVQEFITSPLDSKLIPAVKSHTIKAVETDFEGNATFEKLPKGTYYIFSIAKTRGGYIGWSYPATTGEKKPILLDQNNAFFVQ